MTVQINDSPHFEAALRAANGFLMVTFDSTQSRAEVWTFNLENPALLDRLADALWAARNQAVTSEAQAAYEASKLSPFGYKKGRPFSLAHSPHDCSWCYGGLMPCDTETCDRPHSKGVPDPRETAPTPDYFQRVTLQMQGQ